MHNFQPGDKVSAVKLKNGLHARGYHEGMSTE